MGAHSGCGGGHDRGISVLASIGQGRERSPEEFLPEAQSQSDKLRYIHTTSTGAVTMLNGDVHRRFTETSRVYTGDMRSRMWYEDCAYPYQEGIRLCGIESVVYDGVRYQKIDTSEGPGEWEVMGKDPPSPYSYPTGEPYDPEELLKWLGVGLITWRSWSLRPWTGPLIDGSGVLRAQARSC